MPKLTDNPKSRTQIQADSDAKRSIKLKAFKLHTDDIDFIVQSAKELGLNQNELLMNAIRDYVKKAQS
ncbi:hypothetical protein AAX05_03335 [Moraxella bovoculi]|uniref:hypothetical protein n=1 Tax=Moraxella bovoculi TaxID=386891 RepID=UPI0006244562|nr:hypothetical protein [Moraxella bovoculi]AKG09367.1 hypothetical protein AAX05_03335 [Moraxella bovoculi]AKG13193.1 hypothetical protein AAX11_03085 [Moraxella bovoculi]